MLVTEPARTRPSTCARRSSSSIRVIPRANASRSSEPVPSGSHSFLQVKLLQKRGSKGGKNDGGNLAYQMSRRRCGSSRDLSHILHTRRPSSLASDPGSGAGVGVGAEYALGSISIDNPRQPAFWRFIGGGLGVCARTLAMKSASYRAR